MLVVFLLLNNIDGLKKFSKQVDIYLGAQPMSTPSIIKQNDFTNMAPKKVTFSFFAPQARRIFLVGDFNAWGVYPLEVPSDPEGNFSKSLVLPKGKYKYYFDVDGQKVLDEKAPKIIFEGEEYSLLSVK